MSAAEQFKAGVSERSGPKDWRGGLERSHARRDGGSGNQPSAPPHTVARGSLVLRQICVWQGGGPR
jgi:hypothetical protein